MDHGPPSGVFIPPTPGAPVPGAAEPPAVTWLRVFSSLQVLLALLLLLLGVGLLVLLLTHPPSPTPGDPPDWIAPLVLILPSVPFIAVNLVGILAPRRKWMFAYGLVLACLSFACGGCWPLGIVVLVYWFRPETKAWYETGGG